MYGVENIFNNNNNNTIINTILGELNQTISLFVVENNNNNNNELNYVYSCRLFVCFSLVSVYVSGAARCGQTCTIRAPNILAARRV